MERGFFRHKEACVSEFLNVVLAFPTLPYSIVLGFAVLYWLLVSVGLVDEDGLGSGDGVELHGQDGLNGVSAMFARLGLGGAPTMLVILLLAFFSWSITYFAHLFFLQSLPSLLRWIIGSAVALAALVPAAVISAWVLRPIRRLLLKLRPIVQESLLGKTGIISSPTVSHTQGYANVDDGGAGLVLQVRAPPNMQFIRGQRIRLVDYQPEHNHYLVVADDEHPALGVQASSASGDKEIHQ